MCCFALLCSIQRRRAKWWHLKRTRWTQSARVSQLGIRNLGIICFGCFPPLPTFPSIWCSEVDYSMRRRLLFTCPIRWHAFKNILTSTASTKTTRSVTHGWQNPEPFRSFEHCENQWVNEQFQRSRNLRSLSLVTLLWGVCAITWPAIKRQSMRSALFSELLLSLAIFDWWNIISRARV